MFSYRRSTAIDQNLGAGGQHELRWLEAANQPGLRTIAQQANAQGITWVAASGDWGAATCDISSPSPQASKGSTATFPATIPEITSVGGTTFNEGSGTYWATKNDASGGSALSYIPEVAWNRFGGAARARRDRRGRERLLSKAGLANGARRSQRQHSRRS